MPALPGTHLVLIHTHLAFASLEARFDASTCLDDSRQFSKRRLLERYLRPTGWREVILIAMPGVLIGGIARGAGPQCAVVRERLPGDHQPFLGSGAFALDLRLHPAPDHLDLYRPFLPVSHPQVRPRLRIEALTPLRHRLPRRLGPPSTPWVRGQRRLEVAHRGGARHPQDIPLTPLA